MDNISNYEDLELSSLINDMDMEVIEMDIAQDLPATAASSGSSSAGAILCGSTSCCSSS